MTADDVRHLAHRVPPHIRAAVLLAAGTGLCQAEVFGLTVDRINFLGRELRVDRQLWTPNKGPARHAPPKTKNRYRTIALSPMVVDGLSAHLSAFGKDGGEFGLVFHAQGRPIVRAVAGRRIRDAVADQKALEGSAFHDLRHHHASVLLSARVSPGLVERLGDTIVTLLKTCAHVIRSDEDRVRGIIDETLGGSAEDFLRTEAG
jgi:integrase